MFQFCKMVEHQCECTSCQWTVRLQKIKMVNVKLNLLKLKKKIKSIKKILQREALYSDAEFKLGNIDGSMF